MDAASRRHKKSVFCRLENRVKGPAGARPPAKNARNRQICWTARDGYKKGRRISVEKGGRAALTTGFQARPPDFADSGA